MCGIAGYLNFTERPVQQTVLERMTDVLRHRGPDGYGHWMDQHARIGLAHRRLSIIDLSERGAQPMQYAEGRFTITFNGEIYNYLELRAALEKQGIRFKSDTDTEVILVLYALEGAACLKSLDGMFSFAIWDDQRGELFCARDRFGEKPFFYYTSGQTFAFASEMKALFYSGLAPAILSQKAIVQYLIYNTPSSVHFPAATFFEGVLQLQPAHYMVVSRSGTIREQRYWDLPTQQSTDSLETAAEQVFSLLHTSVSRRLRADVPVGSSLSGGLDSSAIVLLIDQLKGKTQAQKTFSARFRDFEKDEGAFMQAVLDVCHAEPHFTWPDEQTLSDRLEQIFWHQEEPFGSASILVQDRVMALAREHNTIVLLDGQGPDEMLGGYLPFYSKYYLRDLYRTNRPLFDAERKAFQEISGIAVHPTLLLKLGAYFPAWINSTKGLPKKLFPFLSPEIRALHPSVWPHIWSIPDPFRQGATVTEQFKIATFQQSLPVLLRYADRNSMAHSLEVRLPYLSHELAEYLFALPVAFKLQQGWTKYILRKAVEPLLPKKITWRKDKIGYEPPQDMWLKSPAMQTKLSQAIELLKREHILRQPEKGSAWRYLMVAELIAFSKKFNGFQEVA